jgi:ubiquinone/menaquinone biosynthesis C-methylase UbiE
MGIGINDMEHKDAEHKDKVREEFTRQAPAYAQAPMIKDPLHLQKLIDAVQPAPEARVLEIATGPGHVALAFAPRCREVIGVDLTEAPLKIAERMRAERGLANVRFQQGDVESRLPFSDGEFDVVVCRFAIHHFEHPRSVIAEMSRLCRVGGTVAVEDLIASEHPDRADYYNRFERLRDSSHTRALPMSELALMLAGTGLELIRFSSDGLPNPVERWFDSAQTPADKRAEALAMIERDMREDLSGTNPRRIDGELFFTHRTAILVARKLNPAMA